jgi:hypothetical protein
VILMAGFEARSLLGGRLGLVFLAPIFKGHAVHNLTGFWLGDFGPLFGGGFLIPAAEAVPAEAGQVHQVDVLYIGAAAQMVAQAAEDGRFDLGYIELGHLGLLLGISEFRIWGSVQPPQAPCISATASRMRGANRAAQSA